MTHDRGSEFTLAVIGGSGLYQFAGLSNVEVLPVETPWGTPSDAIVRGRLDGVTVLFLPRHGAGHRLSPSTINYRANLWALRSLGATHVVSVSAVGSLRETIAPGHLVVVDQFVDRTRQRTSTFFDGDLVAHVSTADPVCPQLAAALYEAAKTTEATVHPRGTYVCIEGPRFSTRAESHLFRQWGCDVVGMTNVPECFLARELELPYATLALSTDYDCWHAGEADVDVAAVVQVMKRNVGLAQATLRALVSRLPDPRESPAHRALEFAVMTDRTRISEATRERYAPLFEKYGWR